jgi:hypothetical protein
MEAMSETSCFAHSVQQVSDPLSVLKELRHMTRESALSAAVETLSSPALRTCPCVRVPAMRDAHPARLASRPPLSRRRSPPVLLTPEQLAPEYRNSIYFTLATGLSLTGPLGATAPSPVRGRLPSPSGQVRDFLFGTQMR